MNKFYIVGFLFVSVFLAGCFGSSQPQPRPDRIDNRTDEYYEERISNDQDRDDVIRSSRERYSKNYCEDEDKNHDCFDQCRDIYTRRADKNDCEELSIDQIERLVEIHEFLEDSDEDDLPSIDPEDFDVYLNISIQPLDQLVRKYNKSEAKDFVVWLIKDEDIFDIFQKEDDEYDTFESVLESVSGTNIPNGDTSLDNIVTIYDPFLERIESGDKLMELAIDSGNENIVEWFMEYIFEKSEVCQHQELAVGCFEIYCKIGEDIDEDYRDDWLSYYKFEDYLDEIIERGTNRRDPSTIEPPYYWTTPVNKIENTGDTEDWLNDLCKSGQFDLTQDPRVRN